MLALCKKSNYFSIKLENISPIFTLLENSWQNLVDVIFLLHIYCQRHESLSYFYHSPIVVNFQQLELSFIAYVSIRELWKLTLSYDSLITWRILHMGNFVPVILTINISAVQWPK